MASNINWSEVGAVQRSFDRGPAVKIDKEDVAMLGRSIGDIAGRYNRAATVDNDPELEELKRKLRDAENAKAAAQASGALGGDIDVSPYDEDIEVLKMKIAGREEKVRQLRGEYANDPEYITARREYVVNGDRSHLDSFWRNREAAKLRKAQEEAAKVENAKLVAEQEKSKALALKQAETKVKVAKANLADARKSGERVGQSVAELESAVEEYRHLGGNPEEIPDEVPGISEDVGVDADGLNALRNELADLKKMKVVSDADVAAFVSRAKPFTEDRTFAESARKMVEEAEGIITTDKKAGASAARRKKEADKVTPFNNKDLWERDPGNGKPELGELEFYDWDNRTKTYLPKEEKKK